MKPSPPAFANPFERLGIDPREGPKAITERLRELIEAATTDAERTDLRRVWEELTLHPAKRLRAAFHAHPSSEPRHDAPPPPPPRPPASAFAADAIALTLTDLALFAEVEGALSAPRPGADRAPSSGVPVDEDPLLVDPRPSEGNMRDASTERATRTTRTTRRDDDVR